MLKYKNIINYFLFHNKIQSKGIFEQERRGRKDKIEKQKWKKKKECEEKKNQHRLYFVS